MSSQLANELAQFALAPSQEVLPRAHVDRCKLVVLDTVAAIVGASPESEIAGFGHDSWSLGTGGGPSTVLTSGGTASPYAAAFINGFAATRLELDEGNQWAGNHASAHVIPAALATAEAIRASGMELLEAVSAGYEVAVRVGRATQLRKDVHPFGTAMVVGAAAAVARLRCLDLGKTEQSLLIAAGITPVSMQLAANDGKTVRNAASGECAATGVLAVNLAETGTTGHPDAFEIVYGEILGEAFRAERAEQDDEPYLSRGYFKLHACSRWNHAAIEATRMLMDEEGLLPDDVRGILVATFSPATRLNSARPANGFAARHSIPYAVAARLLYGANGLEEYSDAAVADRRVQELSGLVTVVEDADMTAEAPAIRAARVEVSTKDGRRLMRTADRIPGGPEAPYSSHELLEKDAALLSRGIGPTRAPKLLEYLSTLDAQPDLLGLRELFAPTESQIGP